LVGKFDQQNHRSNGCLFSSDRKAGGKLDLNLAEAKNFLTKVNNGLLILEQLVPSCAQANSSNSLICKNQQTNLDQIKNDIEKTRGTINQINLGVIDLAPQITQANSYLGAIQKIVNNINIYFWSSLIILLALIIAIILLQLNNLPLMAKFISVPLIVSSAVGLVIVGITQSFVPSNFALGNTNLTPEMNSIISDLLKADVLGVFHRLEIIAAIVLAIFLIKYIIVWILEKRNFKFFVRIG